MKLLLSKVLAAAALLAAALPVAAESVAAEPAVGADWPHQLTLYSIPSPFGMDWSSPRALMGYAIKNQVDFYRHEHKHSIGHVFVGIKAPGVNDGRELLVGMTTADRFEQVDLAIKQGYGFGVLAADMLGKFDSQKKLEEDLANRYRTGVVSYIRVLLSPETGARMTKYFDEYQARGLDKHYGGSNRGRYGEGGGCSPFGVSFYDVIGQLDDEHRDAWKVTLNVPARLFGGPETGIWVPATRALAYGRWAREHEPHAKIVMWDPSLMHEWNSARWQRERQDPTGEYTPELRGRARGLVVDARETPTPTGPIWLKDPAGAPHPNFRQGGNHHKYPRMTDRQYATTSMATFQRAARPDPVIAARMAAKRRAPRPRPMDAGDLRRAATAAIP